MIDFFELRENLLGTIKKAVGIKKKRPDPRDELGNKMANDGSNDPAQKLRDKIDELEAKLKVTSKRYKAAQDSTAPDAEDKEDYWGGIEQGQAEELRRLKDKLKKMAG